MKREAAARNGHVAHADTATSDNNLACCLDRLGKPARAVRLLEGALKALTEELGGRHPRTALVHRNLTRVGRRAFGDAEVPERLRKLAVPPPPRTDPDEVYCAAYGEKGRDAAPAGEPAAAALKAVANAELAAKKKAALAAKKKALEAAKKKTAAGKK